MIGSGVLTDDQDHISVIEILKGDRAFPDANGLSKSLSAGFVAHV